MIVLVPIPGGRLYEKIWATIHRGLGCAFRPGQIVREGKARAEAMRNEMLVLAQAQRDVDRIRNGEAMLTPNGELVNLASPPAPWPNVQEEMIEHLRADPSQHIGGTLSMLQTGGEQSGNIQKLQRSINLCKIALFAEQAAEEQIQSDSNVSDEDVSDEWFARWRGMAEDVSDEQMQSLWGRILAGEVKQPRTYSVHSLNLLSALSKTDADLISRLANLDIGDTVLKLDDEQLGRLGFTFEDLLYLQDINVLSGVNVGVAGLSRTLKLTRLNFQGVAKQACVIAVNPYAVVPVFPDNQERLELDVWGITAPARQLMKMCKRKADMEYVKMVGAASKLRGAELVLYGAVRIEGTDVSIDMSRAIKLDV